ncbi:MAG: type III-A CRISPR-associated protein Csm2 [Meiothermus sp.]|uniref:type III-A CRISPR-associated protein Csm2 n=1 Tax=Meiothermus sp. TaxID=1955249 RepID=UPI0025EC3A57|nr:type III-A CRISPR-associated protein Csm2 [Meiothermus sp.]MCS7069707.1 type III-A CRISPR-associated protein Csm2 [Meiothermus sp.]
MEFFEDLERGVYRKGLFDEEAKRWAQELRSEGQGQNKLKSSQFRNYFHEFRRLEDVFERYKREAGEDKELAWRRFSSQIELLRAKLAYGGRSNGGPLQNLPTFRARMDELLSDAKKSEKHFAAAMLFLEAVLAYFYGLEGERNGDAASRGPQPQGRR